MLEFDRVSFAYGSRPVLRDLSFRVGAGECLVLAGPNGAGKSTALALAAGALRPKTGTITASGALAYAPQDAALFRDLSVLDNLRFFARLRRCALPETYPLPIGDVLRRRLGKLSGGMRQRVSLCCALLGDPEVLLLDEPFTGLDSEARGLLYALVDRWKAEGRTLLCAAHDPEEIRRLADRVLSLEPLD